jgi:hypothetical protein
LVRRGWAAPTDQLNSQYTSTNCISFDPGCRGTSFNQGIIMNIRIVFVALMLAFAAPVWASGPTAAPQTTASHADMKGMDMKGMDMKGMDMKGMDMSGMKMDHKGMCHDCCGSECKVKSGMDMKGMDMSGMKMNHKGMTKQGDDCCGEECTQCDEDCCDEDCQKHCDVKPAK